MQVIVPENYLIKIANSYHSLKQKIKTLDKCISIERFSGEMNDQEFTNECLDSINADINSIGKIIERIRRFNCTLDDLE